ncbi:MAG: hypothetical protein QXW10_04510, partial [Candidatus Micrarchaeaceae archaeon]
MAKKTVKKHNASSKAPRQRAKAAPKGGKSTHGTGAAPESEQHEEIKRIVLTDNKLNIEEPAVRRSRG